MARTKWLSSFNVGVQKIDDEHRLIIDVIRKVEDAIEDGRLGVCRGLIQDLEGQIRAHFQTEEAFLEKTGFSGLPGHRALHRALELEWEALESRCKRCETGEKQMRADSCINNLRSFILTDILEGDLQFKSHAQEVGGGRFDG